MDTKKQNKVRLHVLVDEYQMAWLRKKAKQRQVSLGQVVRYWIAYAMQKHK